MHKKPKRKWYEMENPNAETRHHRVCRSHKRGVPHNIVKVKKIDHTAWHVLFGNLKPHDIAEVINKWIDPNYMYICVKTEEYYAAVRELESTQGEVSHLQLVSSTNSHG